MRKLYIVFAILIFAISLSLFTACDGDKTNNDDDDNETEDTDNGSDDDWDDDDNDQITQTVSVENVSLDKSTLTLNVSENATLIATVAPANATNKNLTWSSSAPAIVSVDASGKLTAHTSGTATVTVTTQDGGKIASCTVNVKVPVTGVILNKTALTVLLGQNGELIATVAPANATNKNLTWSSSAPSIVSVDENGKLTAHTSGTATITVTTQDGGKTASCTVNIRVAVSGVTLNKETLSIIVGGSEKLTATVAPENATNKFVMWYSSDNTVASVDSSGTVTAKKVGTATITATTQDGAKKASCTVTVLPVAVTGIRFEETSLTLDTGATHLLSVTFTPSNATNKSIKWSSSDTTVASVDSIGKITAIGQGSATVKATTDDGGKIALCRVTVVNSSLSYRITGTEKDVAVAATETVKDGQNVFYWHAVSRMVKQLGSERDFSDNDYLTFKVYSENATGCTVQIRFSHSDDKKGSNNMAPYFRHL